MCVVRSGCRIHDGPICRPFYLGGIRYAFSSGDVAEKELLDLPVCQEDVLDWLVVGFQCIALPASRQSLPPGLLLRFCEMLLEVSRIAGADKDGWVCSVSRILGCHRLGESSPKRRQISVNVISTALVHRGCG